MKSTFAIISLGAASAIAASASDSTPETYLGCYSAIDEGMFEGQTEPFNSHGQCAKVCRTQGAAIAVPRGSVCLCGNTVPAASALVSEDKCNIPCPGFDAVTCSGENAFSVFKSGVKVDGSGEAEGETYPVTYVSTDVTGYTTTITNYPVTTTASSQVVVTTTGTPSSVFYPTAGNATTSAPQTTSSIPVAGAVSARVLSGSVGAGVLGLAVAYNLF
ncbi:uncharacterized protein B0I36DRAFT_338645 [Microdochium trichocladiopsis]|uniref:WSC domain-containing protein n=1 Tax=Microdochium trichocladiopsis TaxID=1682393 RepID=A0A9P8XS24_9PEZI|nr:uncharacterized protein B0I36DRAFT_338645 [Microdochium trichocladiopsis]KAH7014379.1 hypothetical protein B0I36DRAFT_338645 [Microdochium trichocladiopsis]